VNAVAYLGHATVLMELDGTKLLTDPLLRRRVTHLRRADNPRTEGLDDVDAVLISHAHHDHLHLRSLRLLDRSTRIVVPKGLGRLVKFGRFRFVEEIDEGDLVEIGSLRVRATHAEHSGTRQPGWWWLKAPALGYAIEGSQRIYFAGDTDLFEGMAGLVPDLDVALLPIWGWGPSLGRGLHLDPRKAAEAVALLEPRIAIPIHWGTYRPLHLGARAKFLTRPAEDFAREAASLAPEVDVRVLRPGECLEL
jgi:L-ascorbate metabolism protein UlaG (beta-lactamase superfamily)